MSQRTIVLSTLLALVFFVSAPLAKALTADQIVAEINSIQQQINALTGGGIAPVPPPVPPANIATVSNPNDPCSIDSFTEDPPTFVANQPLNFHWTVSNPSGCSSLVLVKWNAGLQWPPDINLPYDVINPFAWSPSFFLPFGVLGGTFTWPSVGFTLQSGFLNSLFGSPALAYNPQVMGYVLGLQNINKTSISSFSFDPTSSTGTTLQTPDTTPTQKWSLIGVRAIPANGGNLVLFLIQHLPTVTLSNGFGIPVSTKTVITTYSTSNACIITSFTPNPPTITTQGSTLIWSNLNCTSASLTGPNGATSNLTNGSLFVVAPGTYTLTMQPGNVTQSVTVGGGGTGTTPPPPGGGATCSIDLFTATPSTVMTPVTPGTKGNTTFLWTSTGCTSMALSGGNLQNATVGLNSGSAILATQTTVYTLTGQPGNVTKSVTVTASGDANPTNPTNPSGFMPDIKVELNNDSSTLTDGPVSLNVGRFSLVWIRPIASPTAPAASSCTVSATIKNSSGADVPAPNFTTQTFNYPAYNYYNSGGFNLYDGTNSISAPSVITIYKLTCGSATDSVTVNPLPSLTASLLINGQHDNVVVTPTGSMTFTWTTTGAPSQGGQIVCGVDPNVPIGNPGGANGSYTLTYPNGAMIGSAYYPWFATYMSRTYRLHCFDQGSNRKATDWVTVVPAANITVNTKPVSVDIKASIDGGQTWSDAPVSAPLVANAGQKLWLTWKTRNAMSCSFGPPISDYNNNTWPEPAEYFQMNPNAVLSNSSVFGYIQWWANDPAHYPVPGTSDTYTITCTGGILPDGTDDSSTATDSVTLTNSTSQPVVGVDLTASAPTLVWPAVAGSFEKFTSQITNLGSVASGPTFAVKFNIASSTTGVGAVSIGTTTVNTMSYMPPGAGVSYGGSSYPVMSPFYTFTSAGTYYVQACADSGNVFAEVNETNNCSAWAPVTVTTTSSSSSGAGTGVTAITPPCPAGTVQSGNTCVVYTGSGGNGTGTGTNTINTNTQTQFNSCLNLQSNLGYGLRDGGGSADVTNLQKFLMSKGYMTNGTPSGYYGRLTVLGVKAYQRAMGISPVSGFVGPATRAQIAKDTCGVVPNGSSAGGTDSQSTSGGSTSSGGGITFTANNSAGPVTITSGSPVVLSWSTTGFTQCHGSASIVNSPWDGSKDVSMGTHSLTISSQSDDAIYLLLCSGNGNVSVQSVKVNIGSTNSSNPTDTSSGSADIGKATAGSAGAGSGNTSGSGASTGIGSPAKTVTVQGVNGAPSVTVTANHGSITQGQAIVVNWTSNGTGCLVYTGSAPLAAGLYMPATSVMTDAGYQNVTTTYNVSCTNDPNPRSVQSLGTNTTTASVTIEVVYQTAFSATAPTTVASGQSVVINLIGTQATYFWRLKTCNVGNAGTCGSVDSGFVTGASGGGPQGQYYNYGTNNYTVTWSAQAFDKNNNLLWTSPTGSIVVTPNTTGPVTVNSITATPSTINPGGSTTLSWSISGAVWGCSVISGNYDSIVSRWSGATDPNNGNISVSPTKSTAYSIVCNNYAGTPPAKGIQVTVNGSQSDASALDQMASALVSLQALINKIKGI